MTASKVVNYVATTMSTISTDKQQKSDQLVVTFQGRRYRLYKNRAGESYSIRIQRHGKDIARSLGTPLADIARKQAIIFLKAAFSDTWEDQSDKLRQRSASMSTLGELLDLYKRGAPTEIGIKSSSAKRNAGQLLQIVAQARPGDPAKIPLDQIDEQLARDYIKEARAAGRSEASIRSSINQARSLFAPKLLHFYREKLQLPRILGFPLKELNLSGGSSGFVPIPEETIHRMEKAALDELRPVHPSAWRAYLLMARLGLRNSEVEAVRKHWFQDHQGGKVLVLRDRPQEQFKLKNSLEGTLGISQELWEQLTEGLLEDWDYILEERTPTGRHDTVYRDLNNFVRNYLPDRKKGAYELRKWAGSIVATRSGIYAAQQFLRHKSVKVTESYYATYLRAVQGVSGADLASLYRGQAITL